MKNISIKDLLDAGVHFGHKTNRWNPKMSEYLFGHRNGIHIIDLQKTVVLFNEALKVLKDYSSQGKNVLFVGTKRQAEDWVDALRVFIKFVLKFQSILVSVFSTLNKTFLQ